MKRYDENNDIRKVQFDTLTMEIEPISMSELNDFNRHVSSFTTSDEYEEDNYETSGFMGSVLNWIGKHHEQIITCAVGIAAAIVVPSLAVPSLIIAAHAAADLIIRGDGEDASYFSRPNGLLQGVGFATAGSFVAGGGAVRGILTAAGTLAVTETEVADSVGAAISSVTGEVLSNILRVIPWWIIVAIVAVLVITRKRNVTIPLLRPSRGVGAVFRDGIE